MVDTNGGILGLVRTPDAPVFGTDVAVQKARSALLFSQVTAAATLNGIAGTIPAYVAAMQALIGGALTDVSIRTT